MKLTLLGTGTSCGVPVIGCQCEVCRSEDPRDKRTRCSALVETETTRLLIDCGPDFRQQILPQPFRFASGDVGDVAVLFCGEPLSWCTCHRLA